MAQQTGRRMGGGRSETRLEDLARRAGVSISTVSRALNDSPAINIRTKQAIWKLAIELNYPFRRSMPSGPIGADATIAIVVPRPQGRKTSLADSFFLELFARLGDAARERGCDLLVSHIEPATREDLFRAMETSRADGVIFIGQSSLHDAFNELVSLEKRFVVWGAQLPKQAYCSVGSDNPQGARKAALHLMRLGRRKLLFLGDPDAPEAAQRLRGYYDAHEQMGIPVDPERIVPAHFEVESAESAVDALLQHDLAFDGVVAASDLIAIGAMRALAHSNIRVPQDVSVVGYDNVTMSQLIRPALSTVDQDAQKAARLLISKLLDARAGQPSRSERVPTDLIIRESCGA